MKQIIIYLKTKWRVICFAVIASLIFAAAFALYRLPVEAALYPAGIVMLLGALFLAGDYLHTRAKCRELERMLSMIAEMLGELPDTDTLP